MTRPIREVLYVVNGPQNFLIHRAPVAKTLRDTGWSVSVTGPPGEGMEAIENAGFAYHPFALDRRSTNAITEARTLRALIKVYRTLRPPLVHQFATKPVLYGGLAARATGVPCVVSTITGLGYTFVSESSKARLMRHIVMRGYRASFAHANHHVIFQNEDDRSLLTPLSRDGSDRCTVIPGSGIDTDSFPCLAAPANDVPVVTLAGRMLHDKGVEEFVRAADLVREAGRSARFVLVGDTDPGNPAAISRDRLRAWHEAGTVEWWGWSDDIRAVLGRTDIACLPSAREGFPRFLLEAGAAGRPSVATNVPGCRMAVRHDSSGLLVPPKNPRALADAIMKLVDDPALRQRMGQAARQLAVREFDVHRVANDTTRIYERALEQGVRPI